MVGNEISLLRAGYAMADYREYLKIRLAAEQAKADTIWYENNAKVAEDEHLRQTIQSN